MKVSSGSVVPRAEQEWHPARVPVSSGTNPVSPGEIRWNPAQDGALANQSIPQLNTDVTQTGSALQLGLSGKPCCLIALWPFASRAVVPDPSSCFAWRSSTQAHTPRWGEGSDKEISHAPLQPCVYGHLVAQVKSSQVLPPDLICEPALWDCQLCTLCYY